MDTLQNSPIQLAGTQEPLLHRRQIIPGVLLAGRMAAHIWKVLEIEEDVVICTKMPASIATCAHHYTPVPGGETCICGARRQPIKDFLPLTRGKARFHMISLLDKVLNVPKEHTIYVYILPSGQMKTIVVKDDGKWSEPVPLVPVLHKVWELPDALRAMYDEGLGRMAALLD